VGAGPGPQVPILLPLRILELEVGRRGNPSGDGKGGAEKNRPTVQVRLTQTSDLVPQLDGEFSDER
jgi:hypothetical protein